MSQRQQSKGAMDMQPRRDDQQPISPVNFQNTPASVATILSRLLACFPEADTSETAKTDRFRGYMIAVERFPVEALDEAVIRVLQARAYIKGKRINLSFCPSPPELAMLCDEANADRMTAENRRYQPAHETLPEAVPAMIEQGESHAAELNTIIAKVVEKARME